MNMDMSMERYGTAFLDRTIIANGVLRQVVSVIRDTLNESQLARLLIFDDRTGSPIDVDLRKVQDEGQRSDSYPSAESLEASTDEEPGVKPVSKVGRPKLGVVSGEVTLLPRHWEWLKSQPGGASVTLRKLVEEAQRAGETQEKKRKSQEAAYRFMTAMAGDSKGYEEALRELYAGNRERFKHCVQSWEPDVARYTLQLAECAFGRSDDPEAEPNGMNNC
ncbi:hypothetical protein B9G55_14630 [Saccharibacillus sp. O16]|nr:hypothetical protein B9G55_14630 [Saccharibacillus sp. O16]